jgi:hypothetical protein
MKKIFSLFVLLAIYTTTFSQTTTFDIAKFTPPSGWQRIDSNGAVLFQDNKIVDGMLTGFCQLFMFPSRAADNNAAKNFSIEWNGRVAKTTGSKAKPITETQKTPEGWTVVRGHANITQQGLTYTCILYSITGFNKVMSIMVNMAGGDYMPAIESFFDTMDLDAKASVTPSAPAAGSIDIYEFTMPERWFRQGSTGYIYLTQYQTTAYGCTISMLPLQPSSGNLETDAKNIFSQMYAGWQYQYTGENHDDLTKGYTAQGLEYCRMEAAMKKQRPDGYYYDFEKGDVLVIKSGNKIAVLLSRHDRGEMTCFCKHQYEYWGKFFNSLTIKNATVPVINTQDIHRRVIGSWQSIGGSALVKYIFAANSHYQFIGAYSTTTRIDRYTIEMKTSGFKGDGKYSFKDNQIIFNKDGSKPEASYFRFEQLNKGATGWTDRLYIRGYNSVDRKEYEVCYEKERE